MPAISEEYLRTLQALAHPDYDRVAMEANLLAYLQANLPDWTAAPGDNLRRALPLIAELMFLHGETVNANWEQGTLLYSQGDYLGVFGLEAGLVQRAGESDDEYRLRIANTGTDQSLGSLSSHENLVTTFLDTVVDVQAVVVTTNRQDVLVYALKADHTALTASEEASLLEYLNRRENHMAGVVLTLPAVTQTPFTIDVTVRHDSSNSADVVAADARATLYAWLAGGQRIGDPVYRSAVARAAFVTQALDVTVAQPSADLPAVDGTAYTCASDTTDVIVRTAVV